MRVKVPNLENGKCYEFASSDVLTIYWSKKNYVLWFSYRYEDEKTVRKKMSKAAFKRYIQKDQMKAFEMESKYFFADFYSYELRNTYPSRDDYACDNGCCACCGCSCGDSNDFALEGYWDGDLYIEDGWVSEDPMDI